MTEVNRTLVARERLRIYYRRRSTDEYMDRFGGGWRWCLGFDASPMFRSVVVNLLLRRRQPPGVLGAPLDRAASGGPMIDPDKPQITFDDIVATHEGMLMLLARGHTHGQYVEYLGVDPEGLTQVATEAANEEFEHQHGMGPLAVARIRNLSASQRTAVRRALIDTYELAFKIGMTLAYVRAGLEVEP